MSNVPNDQAPASSETAGQPEGKAAEDNPRVSESDASPRPESTVAPQAEPSTGDAWDGGAQSDSAACLTEDVLGGLAPNLGEAGLQELMGAVAELGLKELMSIEVYPSLAPDFGNSRRTHQRFAANPIEDEPISVEELLGILQRFDQETARHSNDYSYITANAGFTHYD